MLFINCIFSQTTASLLTATSIVSDFPRKINKRPCAKGRRKSRVKKRQRKSCLFNGEKTTIYFKSRLKETLPRDSISKKIELNLVPRFLSYSLAEREKRTLGTGLNCIARKSPCAETVLVSRRFGLKRKTQLFFLPAELAKEARNQVFLH